VAERGWEFIWAIAMRSGRLKNAISSYKYDDIKGWAWIFGRILVGYLEANAQVFETYDLIIPIATYVGDGGRSWDHVGLIIERAEIEGPQWPFRRDVMVKTKSTPTMVGLGTFKKRAEMAEQQLRPALHVAAPAAVAGRDVLVFDDVFTGGLSMREAAYKLKDAGATSVAGIVLARQPY
jgi:predicted amidophosphoribosyltransferase